MGSITNVRLTGRSILMLMLSLAVFAIAWGGVRLLLPALLGDVPLVGPAARAGTNASGGGGGSGGSDDVFSF